MERLYMGLNELQADGVIKEGADALRSHIHIGKRTLP